MNKIVNKFLFAEDKFMPKLNLKKDLFIVLVDCLLNIVKGFRNMRNQVILTASVRMN